MMKLLLICIALFTVMSCSGSIPEPTPVQVEWANHQWQNTTAETLRNGRSLYITKCSGCHSVIVPASLSSEKWLEVLPEMSKKSKLLPEESELVKKYLLTMSKQSNFSVKK